MNAQDMLNTIKRALKDYNNAELWHQHIGIVMNKDIGWSTSAKQYVKMYEKILEN